MCSMMMTGFNLIGSYVELPEILIESCQPPQKITQEKICVIIVSTEAFSVLEL